LQKAPLQWFKAGLGRYKQKKGRATRQEYSSYTALGRAFYAFYEAFYVA
jgi:hypothetical protein